MPPKVDGDIHRQSYWEWLKLYIQSVWECFWQMGRRACLYINNLWRWLLQQLRNLLLFLPRFVLRLLVYATNPLRYNSVLASNMSSNQLIDLIFSNSFYVFGTGCGAALAFYLFSSYIEERVNRNRLPYMNQEMWQPLRNNNRIQRILATFLPYTRMDIGMRFFFNNPVYDFLFRNPIIRRLRFGDIYGPSVYWARRILTWLQNLFR